MPVLMPGPVFMAEPGPGSQPGSESVPALMAEPTVGGRTGAQSGSAPDSLYQSAPAPPLLVRGDPAALERAVANLVDNSLKFGTAACISVRAGSGHGFGAGPEAPFGAVPRPGSGVVIVEVRDDGPGIPAGDLPYVFDRFHRSEAARALPGSGLGLAIVKQIVEAHHGRVEAVPQAAGALLRITLPAAAAP
ncbi:sensor histidine kinase [Catenulispora yoronensis]